MLLADLRAVRSFNYIIYDDACHLARFVRNRARKSPRSVLCQLAEATYVIDRFHRCNHTACLQETSRHYLPEVKIERHAVLADLNTSWSESWNAWLDVLTPQMRSIDAAALAAYLWLVADGTLKLLQLGPTRLLRICRDLSRAASSELAAAATRRALLGQQPRAGFTSWSPAVRMSELRSSRTVYRLLLPRPDCVTKTCKGSIDALCLVVALLHSMCC